mmetsp:Transcript_74844/g.167719  ORF Transcript_74844/g.167719 Transcript_74844/m.167719 type:complete len:215 (+) Transcript_74844:770-1414(+)
MNILHRLAFLASREVLNWPRAGCIMRMSSYNPRPKSVTTKVCPLYIMSPQYRSGWPYWISQWKSIHIISEKECSFFIQFKPSAFKRTLHTSHPLESGTTVTAPRVPFRMKRNPAHSMTFVQSCSTFFRMASDRSVCVPSSEASVRDVLNFSVPFLVTVTFLNARNAESRKNVPGKKPARRSKMWMFKYSFVNKFSWKGSAKRAKLLGASAYLWM